MPEQVNRHLYTRGFHLVTETARLLADAVRDEQSFRGSIEALTTHDGEFTGGYCIHIDIDPPGEDVLARQKEAGRKAIQAEHERILARLSKTKAATTHVLPTPHRDAEPAVP